MSVTIEGTTYTPDHGIIDLDPPKLSNAVDRSIFKIRVADPERQYAGVLNDLLNSNIRVRGGFYNTLGETVQDSCSNDVENGSPVLCPVDMLIIYAGKLSKASYVVSPEDGIVIDLECSSPMGALDSNNAFYTTNSGINQYTSGDTSFDYMGLSSKSTEILWGKI